MPKPPILPIIDWKRIFDSGRDFAAWLALNESPDSCKAMDEARKTLPLDPQVEGFLKGLIRPIHVIAIAEDWCGDVVRNVPVLQRLADVTPMLKVRFISREQHPDVFVRFLTNGGEAIPKFIFLSDKYVECGNWGPMPDVCREYVSRGKACGDVGAGRRKVSALYEMDNQGKRMVITDLLRLIDIASTREP